MPELPEVETVARDLRPVITGATISGARCSWARTLRTHSPETIDAALRGRRVEGVGRRAKQLVFDLSDGVAMTVHLKMTGQLFVVPADQPEDPYTRLAIAFADGRELRFRDIRKFGKVGRLPRDPRHRRARDGGRRGRGLRGTSARSRSMTRSRCARSGGASAARSGRLKSLLLDQSFVAGHRQHLRRRGALAARLHPLALAASSLRRPDERRLYDAIRTILTEAVERRGSSIDDYTAPDGDGSMQERLRGLPADGRAVPALRSTRSAGS